MNKLGDVAILAIGMTILKTEFDIDVFDEWEKFNRTGKLDPSILNKIWDKPKQPDTMTTEQF